MNMQPFLQQMIANQASDMFLTMDVPPSLKINGEIVPIGKAPLSETESKEAVLSLMTDIQKQQFMDTHECNFALDITDLGRFRVSAFIQRNHMGCVIRHIKSVIPKLEELGLPSVLKS